MTDLLPSQRSAANYILAVEGYNRVHTKKATEYLSSTIPEFTCEKGIVITTTGSDGRSEKSPFSNIELQVIYAPGVISLNLEDKLRSISSSSTDIFDSSVEIKQLNKDSTIQYGENPRNAFPTRMLDAKYLLGDKTTFDLILPTLYHELQTVEGKEKLKRFKERKREVKQNLNRVLRQNSSSINLETGELSYVPEDISIRSTKHAQLRGVQYSLAYAICAAIANNELQQDAIIDFPKSTALRLNVLKSQDMINPSIDIDKVINAYNNCLYWYHLSEEMSLRENKSIITVNPEELKNSTKIISDFVNTDSLLSIQKKLF